MASCRAVNERIETGGGRVDDVIATDLSRSGEENTSSLNVCNYRDTQSGERPTHLINWIKGVLQGSTVHPGDLNPPTTQCDPRN